MPALSELVRVGMKKAVSCLVAVVLVTTSCTVDEGSDGQPPDNGTTPQPGLSYDEVMAIAVGTDGQPGDIDAFWRRMLPAMDPQASYVSPGLFGYRRDVPPPNACANALRFNAYYCAEDGSIAWEIDFFELRQRSIGDLAPLVIMAHEWGHHIQRTWRTAGTPRRNEAQADCYSGIYVSDAIERGVIAEADFRETIETWYQWGTDTYETDSWFSESEHGPGQARAWAFVHGYLTGDPVYCLSFEEYTASPPLAYPGYTFRVPPGSTVALGEETGQTYDTISGERLAGYIQARPSLETDPTAAEQLTEIADGWFGGTVRYIDTVEAFGATLGGSGAILRFEQSVTGVEGQVNVFHGLLALHIRAQGGGFLLQVYRSGGAPEENAGWEELGDYLYLLMSGLCPEEATTYICSED